MVQVQCSFWVVHFCEQERKRARKLSYYSEIYPIFAFLRDSYAIKYAKLSAKLSINNAGLPCNISNSHQPKYALYSTRLFLPRQKTSRMKKHKTQGKSLKIQGKKLKKCRKQGK